MQSFCTWLIAQRQLQIQIQLQRTWLIAQRQLQLQIQLQCTWLIARPHVGLGRAVRGAAGEDLEGEDGRLGQETQG